MIGFPGAYSWELVYFLGIINLLRYSNLLGGLGIPNTIVFTSYSKLLLPIVSLDPMISEVWE